MRPVARLNMSGPSSPSSPTSRDGGSPSPTSPKFPIFTNSRDASHGPLGHSGSHGSLVRGRPGKSRLSNKPLREQVVEEPVRNSLQGAKRAELGRYRQGIWGAPSRTVLWGPLSLEQSLRQMRPGSAAAAPPPFSPPGSPHRRPDRPTTPLFTEPEVPPTPTSRVPDPSSTSRPATGTPGSRPRTEGGALSAPTTPSLSPAPSQLRLPTVSAAPRGAESSQPAAAAAVLATGAASPATGLVSIAAAAPDYGSASMPVPADRLSNARYLYDALRTPPTASGRLVPVRLLRSSWVLQLAESLARAKRRGGMREVRQLALKRRQEMPNEAYLSAEECERLHPFGWAGHLRVAILAVSHAWRTPEQYADPLLARSSRTLKLQSTHAYRTRTQALQVCAPIRVRPDPLVPLLRARSPDPLGDTLLALAQTIRSMQAKRERRLTDWAQERADFEQAWVYAEVPAEFGIFFECVLHPRNIPCTCAAYVGSRVSSRARRCSRYSSSHAFA